MKIGNKNIVPISIKEIPTKKEAESYILYDLYKPKNEDLKRNLLVYIQGIKKLGKIIGFYKPKNYWKVEFKDGFVGLYMADEVRLFEKEKNESLNAPKVKRNAIIWKEHPDGFEYANYKFGTISRSGSNYTVRLDYKTVLNAKNLTDAKKKIDTFTTNKLKTKKSKPMSAPAKKPTAAQLAARKKFAEMAKNGTLAKKRKASSKKGLKAPKKRTITAKKLCSKVIRREGLKVDGTLKKGYHYTPGGKIVKAKPVAKKKVAKKSTISKKKVVRKKFLGIF